MSESEQRFFGPRFGMNFSKVRIHDDTQTAKAAQDIHARAFTFGHNIVFGAGKYAPNTVAGRKLLAHELTHSIQQRGASKTGHIQRSETKAEQSKRLKEVNKAALTTAVAEIKVSTAKPHWAKKISSTHLTNLSKVISYFNTAIPDLKTGGKKVEAAIASLKKASKGITEMRQEIDRARAHGYPEKGISIQYLGRGGKVKNGVDLAAKLLKESKAKGINGLDKWIKKVTDFSAKIDAALSAFLSTGKADLSKLRVLRDAINNVRSDFSSVRYKFVYQFLAASKIQFVLRYFLALNMAGYTNVPSLKEAIAVQTKLSSIDSNMVLIFGGSIRDYELFREFESQLQEQIWTRSEMKKALGAEPGLKPGKSDVIKWFKSLKKASNSAVIEAYRNFATGFFSHRHEADPSVIATKQTLSSIFTRPTTLSGARLVVCSGFAVLGKRVLKEAGAEFKNYYIGLQASDKQIKCSTTYNDAHALTHLTRTDPINRKSIDLYVSNNDIVFSKKKGIGRTVWVDSTIPVY